MFVGVLLAAGLLALERSEHAYSRLVRGLVSPSGLLSEKITAVRRERRRGDARDVRARVAVRAPGLGPVPAVGRGAGARRPRLRALGVAIGGLARDVSVASLMAFLVSLPIAFVALVPGDAVSGTLKSILDAVAFVFPFKAALQAVVERVQRDGAGDRLAARAPRGAHARVRRARPPRDASASPDAARPDAPTR